jgi:hypothetical protein
MSRKGGVMIVRDAARHNRVIKLGRCWNHSSRT